MDKRISKLKCLLLKALIRGPSLFFPSDVNATRTACDVIILGANNSKCGRSFATTSADSSIFSFCVLIILKKHFPFSMSEQAGYSPNFKRPSEIMRMRRKRARLSTSGRDSTESPGQSDSSPSCVRPFSPGPLFNPHNRPGAGIKRRNPFASIENTYSPKKKLVIYNDDGNVEAVDLNKMKKSSEKEGDEDMSRKTDCRTSLPFSARLTEAEKWKDKDISPKVCSTVRCL